jgi:hypothetical protein
MGITDVKQWVATCECGEQVVLDYYTRLGDVLRELHRRGWFAIYYKRYVECPECFKAKQRRHSHSATKEDSRQ